jgi:hypothetical protein
MHVHDAFRQDDLGLCHHLRAQRLQAYSHKQGYRQQRPYYFPIFAGAAQFLLSSRPYEQSTKNPHTYTSALLGLDRLP